ncbi:MAG TPA: thiamine phosphate synthase [Acidobacteriota bacterium]|nr:thiamine phosphate synthase [Acidobacteriota bacterium]
MPIFESISKKRNLSAPFRYAISSRLSFPSLDPVRYLDALFRTSAMIVQWREKDLPPEVAAPFVRHGIEVARRAGKLFIVNSYTSMALEERADGVHLTSLQSVAEAVRARNELARAEFLIGKSVHAVEEALQAEAEGADYLLLGPVFDPLSKAPQSPPLGLEKLRQAVERVGIPVIALGGIDKNNAAEVLQTGVAGIAGISWVIEEVEALIRNG